MHELALAQNIIETIHQAVPPETWKDVRVVRLQVGTMAGVVPDSLQFSFTALVSGTPLEEARMEIQQIPFVVECETCGQTSTNDTGISCCGECGSGNTRIRSGTELQVVNLELEDVQEEAV
jgi:hydrogenase nickel incorporation protein HypA/HybF